MGCIQKNQQIIIQKPVLYQKNPFYSNYKNTLSLIDRFSTLDNSEKNLQLFYKNKSHKLTKKLWMRVLSFLNFNELKEIGKVNRMFNFTVKQKDILIKFFKREYILSIEKKI